MIAFYIRTIYKGIEEDCFMRVKWHLKQIFPCWLKVIISPAQLGYRKEVEMEIKEVLMSDHRHTSEADINAVIDQGMLRLRDLLTNAALKGRSVEAVDSKVKHANTLVDLDYGAGMASHYKMSGGDWALLQNVQAFHFMGVEKRDALIRLTETIPPPELLMPFSNKKKLKGYFPDEEIYPSAFGPGLAA